MSTRKIKTSEVKNDVIKKENENELTPQKKPKIKKFKGRLNGRNFFISMLFIPIISLRYLIFVFVFWALLKLTSTIFGIDYTNNSIISLVLIILTLLIPSLITTALIVKRHHDFNQSGYYCLIIYIIICILGSINQGLGGLIVLIYFCYLIFKTGTNGNNKYGDEDKQKGLKNILGIRR